MRIITRGDRLNVSEIDQLTAANSQELQAELRAALPAGVRQINVDLSRTSMVDCCGLGALIALRNSSLNQNPDLSIRLFHATPSAQRVFKLIEAHRLFADGPALCE